MLDPTNIRDEERRSAEALASAQTLSELEKADLVWLMGQARGRRFVWRLLEKTGLYRTSFTGNSTTFFNEGQRNIGLWVQSTLLAHCSEDYVKMLLEQKEYRQ